MKVIDFLNANCKHCYKCVRSCSVKAIRIKNAQAQIMDDHCVLCGHCLEVCPQNAKTFASDLDRVKDYLKQGKKTIVSIAPSYLGILKYKHPGQVVDALLKLGFSEVRETSEGAAYVTEEYRKLLDEGKMDNIISTCCPSVNDLVEKYYPDLTPFMAPVVSPMIAHGMLIKELHGPDVKVVFLGPCISKKEEAEKDERTKGYVDGVITFYEFKQWLDQENIDLLSCEPKPMSNPDPKINKLYPVRNGVVKSVLAKHSKDNYRKMFIDGIEDCRELFESIEKGEVHHCFIEANMCIGGCVKGSAIDKATVSRYQAYFDIEEQVEYADPDYDPWDFKIPLEKSFYSRVVKERMPTEEEIQKVLKATGKYNKTQELNCGACGYGSCREKAIAVCQGKAEKEMCLPNAFEKAQSMSNVVLECTPNGVLVVDSDLKIMEFNQKAEEMFHLSRAEAIEKYIYEIMDPTNFSEVLESHKSILRKKEKMEEYQMMTLQTIVYIPEQESMLAIIQDITEDEQELEKQYQLKMDTVEVAQNVIEKQMMVAQEIAGLLGETTAETKVILNRLKRSILND